MNRFCLTGVVTMGVVLFAATAGPAATIQEVMATPFNPALYDFRADYGHMGYFLTWDNLASNYQFLAGQAHRDFTAIPPANPSWLSFTSVAPGGRPGSSDGSATSITRSVYMLTDNRGTAWSMDLSILLYDPTFSGTDMAVELEGSVAGKDDYKGRDFLAAEVQGGTMVKYHIDAAAGEVVSVAITSNGDEAYAAGFFMDAPPGSDLANALPEPATMGLLILGLGGLVARRRRP
jgi:hypothetical protein